MKRKVGKEPEGGSKKRKEVGNESPLACMFQKQQTANDFKESTRGIAFFVLAAAYPFLPLRSYFSLRALPKGHDVPPSLSLTGCRIVYVIHMF
jgi:hypothetical protein